MHESTLSGNYHATVMDMNWYNLEAINIKEEFNVKNMKEKLIIEDEHNFNTSWVFKTSYQITNGKDEFVHQILVIVRPFTSTWNTLYTSTFMFRFCFQPSHLPLHHHLLLAWFGNEFFFPVQYVLIATDRWFINSS